MFDSDLDFTKLLTDFVVVVVVVLYFVPQSGLLLRTLRNESCRLLLVACMSPNLKPNATKWLEGPISHHSN